MRAAKSTLIALTEHLGLEDTKPSMGTVGDAYDNSLMESTNGLGKNKLIRPEGPWRNGKMVTA